jgi:hypothetical protein
MIKKLLWYGNRLASMSLVELAYRIKQQIIKRQERIAWKQRTYSPQSIDKRAVSSLHQLQQERLFFFIPDKQQTITISIRHAFSAEVAATITTADALYHHQIQLFGKQIHLGETIDWHHDPLTKQSWPQTFAASIDTRDGKTVGGVKWVWELNRHHHLVTLGKAYFLTDNEQYAQEVCTQWQGWVQANPPLTGINWTSALELAIRLINWGWALALIQNSPALSSTLYGQLVDSIAQQAAYINRHLSAYSSANNHLIGEAAGLAFVGLYFPHLPAAPYWREQGLTILEQELPRQIYADGVPAEQTPAYLTFVLDFYLQVWRLAELNGYKPPTIWYERLAAACEFLQHVMDEAGNVPQIGDSDDAQVVRLSDNQSFNNCRSILATAAVILNRPDFKASAGQWDEKSHWLLGEEGAKIFESLPDVKSKPGSRAFREGGYCVMRTEDHLLIFDCGPLGYLSTAAHGHADALNLLVHANGQPLLIDPGTYAYQEGGKWRDYFRSTAAHNTVVVDGLDQSEMQGDFLWGKKANAKLLHWQSNDTFDLAIAEHDGYKNIGVIHQRTVLFYKPDWVLVVDDLRGKGNHLLEQLWHLPAQSQVQVKTTKVDVTVGNTFWQLKLLNTPAAAITVPFGQESPIQGWLSAHYGHKEAAPVIKVSAQVDLPQKFMAVFCLKPRDGDADLAIIETEILPLYKRLLEEKLD